MELIDTTSFLKPNPIFIVCRPTTFNLAGTFQAQRGILATDGDTRTYVYPLVTDPFTNPVQFLNEALRIAQSQNNILFLELIKKAYLNHADITFTETFELQWHQYEFLLKECSFYEPLPPPAEILVLEDVDSHSGNQEDIPVLIGGEKECPNQR